MRSPAMCSDEPSAPTAIVYLLGCARTCSTKAAMSWAGKSCASPAGWAPASMLMGVKSRTGSKGSLRYSEALIEKLVKVTSSVLPSGALLAT